MKITVTGNEVSAAQGGEGGVVAEPTIVVERKEPVTEQTPDEKDTGIPGFSLLTGFTIMLVVHHAGCSAVIAQEIIVGQVSMPCYFLIFLFFL